MFIQAMDLASSRLMCAGRRSVYSCLSSEQSAHEHHGSCNRDSYPDSCSPPSPFRRQPSTIRNRHPTDTAVTYGSLSFVVPPGVAGGASGSEYPRVDSEDAAWWQKTPGHLQVTLGDYYVLQGKFHQPQVSVYPAQAYAELVPPAFESLHRLNNILGIPMRRVASINCRPCRFSMPSRSLPPTSRSSHSKMEEACVS